MQTPNYFFEDANSGSLSYQEIFDFLNTATAFNPVYLGTDLKAFFLNFLLGIAHGQQITLVDLGLDEEKVKELIPDFQAESITVSPLGIQTTAQFLRLIGASKAKLQLFTSGTTGRPKAVIHPVSRFINHSRIGADYNKHVWGLAYNPTHMAGLQVIFQALVNGSSLVYLFNKEKKAIHEQVRARKISHLSATPTFYRLLFPSENPFDEVQRVTLGGEKSDQHLIGRIQKLFPQAKINNIYASSEAGTILVSKQDHFEIPTKLLDLVRVNEANELEIHASLLGQVDKRAIDKDWYKTGDIVNFIDDSRQRFTFAGRKQEMLNIGGNKVNPNKVAETIMEYPGVKNALVYGKANSVIGTILRCEIVCDTEVKLTEKEVRDFLKTRLLTFEVPRMIKFVAEIALTRTGKISKIGKI